MIISFEKNDVYKIAQTASLFTSSKIGAYSCIWIKCVDRVVYMYSSDTNIEYKAQIKAKANEYTDVIFGIPSKKIAELLSKLPEGIIEIEYNSDSTCVYIRCGKRKYSLPTVDSSWFAEYEKFEDSNVYLNANEIDSSIRSVQFCIGDDDDSGIGCCYIHNVGKDNLSFVGLNGFMFAKKQILDSDLSAYIADKKILIKRKYISLLSKWLNTQNIVEFSLTEKRFFLKGHGCEEQISIPLSEYVFPDYTTFVSKTDSNISTIVLERKSMFSTLNRISIFTTENEKIVSLCLDSALTGSIQVLHSNSSGTVEEFLDCKYDGTLGGIISFPVKNLSDILSNFNSENIQFCFTGLEGPCKIYDGEDDSYISILMPMKNAED